MVAGVVSGATGLGKRRRRSRQLGQRDLLGGRRDDVDDKALAARVGRLYRRPIGPEAGAEIDCHEVGRVNHAHTLDEPWHGSNGWRGIDCVGVEADEEAASLLHNRVAGARRQFERDARGTRRAVDRNRNPRYARVADDHEARPRPHVDPRIAGGREGAAQERDRHEPPAAIAYHGKWQRHEPSGNRGDILPGCESHGSALARQRDAAGHCVLANRDRKERREVAEDEHLVVARGGDRESGPAGAGYDGVRTRWPAGRDLPVRQGQRQDERQRESGKAHACWIHVASIIARRLMAPHRRTGAARRRRPCSRRRRPW